VDTGQNTLELAKQGDPAAIAVILTYYLSQRFNTTASAIRLGNYLSVLIDADFATDQGMLVNLILNILRDLRINGITILEISTRQIGDREVQWSQTIEIEDSPTQNPMTTDSSHSDLLEHDSPAAPTSPDRSSDRPDHEWNSTLNTVLQRPEMVALIAFAIILVLWDAYLEWMEEVDSTQTLTGTKLARRLGVSASTLSRVKERANFSQWSKDLDPDGIAWSYENKVFVPRVN
jgi:cytochrome bd-type quinol oxidase subunit 1